MTEPKDIQLSQSMSNPQQNAQRPHMTTRSSTTTTNSSSHTTPSTRNPSVTVPPPFCRLPQLNQHGHPVDVLSRNYPPPSSPINVEEALSLPAQPGTFRYQLEKGKETEARVISDETKKEEFERVKNVLKGWGK